MVFSKEPLAATRETQVEKHWLRGSRKETKNIFIFVGWLSGAGNDYCVLLSSLYLVSLYVGCGVRCWLIVGSLTLLDMYLIFIYSFSNVFFL